MQQKSPKDEGTDVPESPSKRPWVRPSLERLGAIRDLVQGGGKVGSNLDGDPVTSRKQGTG
ncbi:MAG: hypothetical protein EP343_14635 [Deltaproteobacteria bacterium]|nr:MAG: hypothetical protein EP343_14635 [Deltaproteobacteria bacterium]